MILIEFLAFREIKLFPLIKIQFKISIIISRLKQIIIYSQWDKKFRATRFNKYQRKLKSDSSIKSRMPVLRISSYDNFTSASSVKTLAGPGISISNEF